MFFKTLVFRYHNAFNRENKTCSKLTKNIIKICNTCSKLIVRRKSAFRTMSNNYNDGAYLQEYWRLKVVNYFCKNVQSETFDKVQNTLLNKVNKFTVAGLL